MMVNVARDIYIGPEWTCFQNTPFVKVSLVKSLRDTK